MSRRICRNQFHLYYCVLGEGHKEEKHRSAEGFTWYSCNFCGRNHSNLAHPVIAKSNPRGVMPTPEFLERQQAKSDEPKPEPIEQASLDLK